MGIGARIGEIAKEKKIPLKELSRRVDIPYTTLYHMVSRDSKVDFDTACKVAAALGVEWVDVYPDNETAENAFIKNFNDFMKDWPCGPEKRTFDEAVRDGLIALNFENDKSRADYYMKKLNDCGKDIAVQTAFSIFNRYAKNDNDRTFQNLLKQFDDNAMKEIADKVESLAQVAAYQKQNEQPTDEVTTDPDKK